MVKIYELIEELRYWTSLLSNKEALRKVIGYLMPLINFAIRHPKNLNLGGGIIAFRNSKVQEDLTLIGIKSIDSMSKFIAKYPNRFTFYVGYCQKPLDCPKDDNKTGKRSKDCIKCIKKDELYGCQVGLLKEKLDEIGSKLKIVGRTDEFIKEKFLRFISKTDKEIYANVFVSCPVMRKFLLPFALSFYRPDRSTIIFDLKYNVCGVENIGRAESCKYDKQTFPSDEASHALLVMLDKAIEYRKLC